MFNATRPLRYVKRLRVGAVLAFRGRYLGTQGFVGGRSYVCVDIRSRRKCRGGTRMKLLIVLLRRNVNDLVTAHGVVRTHRGENFGKLLRNAKMIGSRKPYRE
jgi:hypothetical protein